MENHPPSSPAVDARLIKALGHPLRQRILAALGDEVASPKALAQRLDEPLGNVSYHVKILASCGAVELVRTAPVRGAVEHFYRATLKPEIGDEHWAGLPPSARRVLFDQRLQKIWEQLAATADGRGFDPAHSRAASTTVELDQQGYEEMSKALAEALDRVREIEDAARARIAEAPARERETVRANVAIIHFAAPRGDGEVDPSA